MNMCRNHETDDRIKEIQDHLECAELRCRELEDEKRKLQYALNCAESELNRLKRGIIRIVQDFGGEPPCSL